MLALLLGGCARKEPVPPPVVYPYSSGAAKAFYATGSGLSESPPRNETAEGLHAAMAPNASVLGADGTTIAVAINGWGMETVEASPDGSSYRLVGRPLASAFAGLTTGGAWPLGGGYLVQLYRHPFVEGDQAPETEPQAGTAPAQKAAAAPQRGPSAARLVYLPANGGAATTPDPFPRGSLPGFELFALLPSGGGWYAELRRDGTERVDLKFFALADPLAAPGSADVALREIGRAEFEAALRPRPLAACHGDTGQLLGAALAALGTGPWLARLRGPGGEDSWYIDRGGPEDASSVYAWAEGGSVLALSADGRLARTSRMAPVALSSLRAPVEGASFTALAAAGGFVAAAWEEGEFPELSLAGIVLTHITK